jgi:hypothetical protein
MIFSTLGLFSSAVVAAPMPKDKTLDTKSCELQFALATRATLAKVKDSVLKVKHAAPGASLSYGDESDAFVKASREHGYYDVLRKAEVNQFMCETELLKIETQRASPRRKCELQFALATRPTLAKVKDSVLKVRHAAPGASLSYGDESDAFEKASRELGYYDVLRAAKVKQFNCETKLVE